MAIPRLLPGRPTTATLSFWSEGKINRINVASGTTSVIPVHIKTTKKVRKTLRFPVDVAADDVQVKMLRWAQYAPDSKHVTFQALGHLYTKNLTF